MHGFKSGNLTNHRAHWSVHQCNEVSAFLEKVKLPSEVDRKLRGLNELPHWKGIEYQSFLLYPSIVVVKKFFTDPKIFNHFLLYYCSIVICSRNDQCSSANYDVAQCMMNDFLINFKALYGIDHFSSNLHNLTHLVDDVRRFGPLHTISAYPFESKLFLIKRMVRSGNMPLSQIANRVSEFQQVGILNAAMKKSSNSVAFKKELKNVDGSDASLLLFLESQNAVIYAEAIFPYFKLSAVDDKNRWFLSKSSEVVCIKYIIKTSANTGNVFFYASSLRIQSNYFEFPIRSSELNIYQSDCKTKEPTFFSESDIYCKMVRVNYDDQISVFIPLYETIKKK